LKKPITKTDVYTYENGEKVKMAGNIEFGSLHTRFFKTANDTLGLLYLKTSHQKNDLCIYENGENRILVEGISENFSVNYQGTQILYAKKASDIYDTYDVFVSSLDLSKNLCIKKNAGLLDMRDILTFGFSTNGYFGNYFRFDDLGRYSDVRLSQKVKEEYKALFVPEAVRRLPERTLFFSNLNDSLNYYVAKRILQNCPNATVTPIHFPLPYDDGENFIVTVPKGEDYLFFILTQLTECELTIYGYSIKEIIDGMDTVRGFSPSQYPPSESNKLIFKELGYSISLRETCKEIQKHLSFSTNYEAIQYFFEQYLAPVRELHSKKEPYVTTYLHAHPASIDEYKTKRAEVIEQLILEGSIPIKWRSEADLFRLVKKDYEDAEFHATRPWLSPQHFDVYIPSLKIAIEYQGIQHFISNDFFGGEEGLKKTIERDKRKKNKCLSNGVTLIEWMYDEPIIKNNLQKKLNQHLTEHSLLEKSAIQSKFSKI
jgi:hypothetical protein